MWEVVMAILLPTIAPGLALLRILDASADTFRKALLCFPIGLLAMYGTSGLLFVLQAWSVTNLTIALILHQRIIDCFFVPQSTRRANHIHAMAKNGSSNPWPRS